VSSLQQVLQIAAEDAHRPVPLQAFVEDAVSICTIFAGESRCLSCGAAYVFQMEQPLGQGAIKRSTEE